MDPITAFCGPWCFMPDFVLANTVLTPAEKLVYCGIARRTRLADDRPSAWPGLEDIAKHTGLSRATVHKAVKALVAEGLIQKTHQHKPDGGLTSNRYTLIPVAERAEAALSTPPCSPDTTPVQVPDHPRLRTGPEADTLKQIEEGHARSKTRSHATRSNEHVEAPLASMEEPETTETPSEQGKQGVSVNSGGAARPDDVLKGSNAVHKRSPRGTDLGARAGTPVADAGISPQGSCPATKQRPPVSTVAGAGPATAASTQGPGAVDRPGPSRHLSSPPKAAPGPPDPPRASGKGGGAPGLAPPPDGPRRVMYDGDLPPDDPPRLSPRQGEELLDAITPLPEHPPPKRPRSPKQKVGDAEISLGNRMAELWEERIKPACGLPGASSRKASWMRKAAQSVKALKDIAPELIEDHDELVRRTIVAIARCSPKMNGYMNFDFLFPKGNLAKLLNSNYEGRDEEVRFTAPGKEQ